MNTTQLHIRLQAFRARLASTDDPNMRTLYQVEINDMEAELAVRDLLDDIDQKPWEITTDSLQTILDLCHDPSVIVISLDRRWSWRWLKRMWNIKYRNL